jgi:hypothetical protein
MLAALHRPLASLCRILALLVFALVFDTGIAMAKHNHGGRHGAAGHGGTTAGHGRGGYSPKSANRHGAPGGFGGPNAGFVCEPNSAWYDPESRRHRE